MRTLIEPQHHAISVARQCELVGLARSSLYFEPKGESAENLVLMRLIDEQYTRTPFYGSPKITWWLGEQGYPVNHKRVERLMRKMGLCAIFPKPRLSENREPHTVFPYLLRGVRIERPNQVWSTDITYIVRQEVVCGIVMQSHSDMSDVTGCPITRTLRGSAAR